MSPCSRAVGCPDGALCGVTGLSGSRGERRLEQAARMIAMKNATDNAGELIELQLVYNKASRRLPRTGRNSSAVGNRRRAHCVMV